MRAEFSKPWKKPQWFFQTLEKYRICRSALWKTPSNRPMRPQSGVAKKSKYGYLHI
jgi:hypothetical protein